MSAQIVLLPVFVLVGLTFALLLVGTRRGSLAGDETKSREMALSQSDLPLFFYILIALALPLRHAALVIVLLSWVFVVTCFARAGFFVTSNDVTAGLAGVACGRACAVRDVDLLRVADSFGDLGEPQIAVDRRNGRRRDPDQ